MLRRQRGYCVTCALLFASVALWWTMVASAQTEPSRSAPPDVEGETRTHRNEPPSDPTLPPPSGLPQPPPDLPPPDARANESATPPPSNAAAANAPAPASPREIVVRPPPGSAVYFRVLPDGTPESGVARETVVQVPARAKGPSGIEPERTGPTWSLGAGLSVSDGSSLSTLGTLAALSGGAPSVPRWNIAPTVLFERHLGTRYHLVLEPELYFTSERTDDTRERRSQSVAATIRAGLRWVVNPGATVQFGFAHVIAAGTGVVTIEAETYRQSGLDVDAGTAWGETKFVTDRIGLENHLVVEAELTDDLWLRASASMFDVYYSRTELETRYPDDNLLEFDEASGYGLGLRPRGALKLRLAF